MLDKLMAFRSDESVDTSVEEQLETRELLVLEQGDIVLAVPANAVDSVVSWQEPASIPDASPRVLGVVQDRGRLVAVARPLDPSVRPRRLIVCRSELGLIGIAGSAARSVGTVTLLGVSEPDKPVSTQAGTLTILDIEALARDMVAHT